MTQKVIKLTKEQIALAATIDEEATRSKSILSCLSIRDGEVAVADDFMLATCPIDTNDEVALPAAPIMEAQKITMADEVSIIIGDEKIRVYAKNEKTGEDIITSGKPIAGKYPNYKALTRMKNKSLARISLSPDLLMKLCILAQWLQNDIAIQLVIRGETDPVEFIIGNYHGLVLPMCTGWNGIKTYPVDTPVDDETP